MKKVMWMIVIAVADAGCEILRNGNDDGGLTFPYGHLSFLKNRFAGFSWASAADCGDLSDPNNSREDFQRIYWMSFRISIHVFVCSQVLKDRRWLRSQPRQHAWGVLPESWGSPATFEWWCAQDAPLGNGIPESSAGENPIQQQLSWIQTLAGDKVLWSRRRRLEQCVRCRSEVVDVAAYFLHRLGDITLFFTNSCSPSKVLCMPVRFRFYAGAKLKLIYIFYL